MAEHARVHERRKTIDGGRVRIRVPLEQETGRIGVTAHRRHHQGGPPRQICRVDVRAPIEQELDDLIVPVRRRDHERRGSAAVTGVERRARDEQGVGRPGVATIRSVEQGLAPVECVGHVISILVSGDVTVSPLGAAVVRATRRTRGPPRSVTDSARTVRLVASR